MKLFAVLSVLFLLTEARRDSSGNSSIKDVLNEEENEKNILSLLARRLDDDEDRGEDFCDSILGSDSTILGLQNIRLRDIVTLKGCFNRIKNPCRKPKRRPRKKQKRNPRREPKCGYKIIGAGSSSNEDDTYFTPVIYKQRRGIRARGNQITIWLSDTPNTPFTKIDGASDYSIASMARLKVAVHKNRKKREIPGDTSSFGKLLMALKKFGGKEKGQTKRKPSTRWVNMFVINAQLDTKDEETAQKQLGVLLEYLNEEKINKENNSIILTFNTNKMFGEDLGKMLRANGLVSAEQSARDTVGSTQDFSTFVWIKDLQSIVYTYTKVGNVDSLVNSILYQ